MEQIDLARVVREARRRLRGRASPGSPFGKKFKPFEGTLPNGTTYEVVEYDGIRLKVQVSGCEIELDLRQWKPPDPNESGAPVRWEREAGAECAPIANPLRPLGSEYMDRMKEPYSDMEEELLPQNYEYALLDKLHRLRDKIPAYADRAFMNTLVELLTHIVRRLGGDVEGLVLDKVRRTVMEDVTRTMTTMTNFAIQKGMEAGRQLIEEERAKDVKPVEFVVPLSLPDEEIGRLSAAITQMAPHREVRIRFETGDTDGPGT